MQANIAKTLVSAAVLAAAFASGQALAAGVAGDRYGYEFRSGALDTFTEGARGGVHDRNPFTDGARSATRERNPFVDGARKVDPYTDGARGAAVQPARAVVARVGKTDPYTDSFHTVDPYTNGGRSVDPYTDGARQVDPFTDGARIAGLDRRGVSSEPGRTVDPYTDGARNGSFDVYSEGARA